MKTYKSDEELREEAAAIWRQEFDSPNEAFLYLKVKNTEDAVLDAFEVASGILRALKDAMKLVEEMVDIARLLSGNENLNLDVVMTDNQAKRLYSIGLLIEALEESGVLAAAEVENE